MVLMPEGGQQDYYAPDVPDDALHTGAGWNPRSLDVGTKTGENAAHTAESLSNDLKSDLQIVRGIFSNTPQNKITNRERFEALSTKFETMAKEISFKLEGGPTPSISDIGAMAQHLKSEIKEPLAGLIGSVNRLDFKKPA